MPDFRGACVATAAALLMAGFMAAPAMGQSTGGKIVCWKDKAGKVIGCGDSVPPEYRDSAATEFDRRGTPRKTIESAEEAARRRGREEQLAREKKEEDRRLVEQKRRDAALLGTYANEKEIDQRRDREIEQIDRQIAQMQSTLKNAADRHQDARKRNAKNDMARAAADMENAERSIAAREKEKEEILRRYAAQKKRYVELRGGK
jgi:hypothetical protein